MRFPMRFPDQDTFMAELGLEPVLCEPSDLTWGYSYDDDVTGIALRFSFCGADASVNIRLTHGETCILEFVRDGAVAITVDECAIHVDLGAESIHVMLFPRVAVQSIVLS